MKRIKINIVQYFVMIFIILIISSTFPGGATILQSDSTQASRSSWNESVSTGGHLRVTVKSEDNILIKPKTMNQTIQLSNNSNYIYANKEEGLQGYQPGDDIFKKKTIISIEEGRQNSYSSTFSKNHIYIDDPQAKGNVSAFEKGDDIYKISHIKESAQILEEGVKYKPPRSNIKYLSLNNSGKYLEEFSIIQSEDHILGMNDTIIMRGKKKVLLNLSDSGFQIWEDDNFLPGYDAVKGNYGEIIYQSGGDGYIDPGEDIRKVKTIITTKRDQNLTTIDIGLGNVTLVEEGDPDIGFKLRDFSSKPTINEIDLDESSVGSFDQGDIIVIDTDSNEIFNKNEDIVINGDIRDKTAYTGPGIEGKWTSGRSYTGTEFVIYDGINSKVDLFFSKDGLTIEDKPHIENINGQLKYYSTNDTNPGYQKSIDGLYIDIGNNNVTSGTNTDLRLTHFTEIYSENTIVQSSDLDSNLSVVNFGLEDKLLDTNKNSQFNIGEPIIKSVNLKLDSDDQPVVNGTLDILSKMEKTKSRIILMEGNGPYNANTPLIRLNAIYEGKSQKYNTNNISRNKYLVLNSFPKGKRDIVVYNSKFQSFSDNSGIMLLERIKLTPPTDFAANQSIDLNEFAQNIGGFVKKEKLQNDSGIYRENDTDTVGPNTFGDSLSVVTVTNNGTLAAQYIKNITLHARSTTIATATKPTANGTWVLEPTGSAAEFGPGNGTEFSLRTTIAPDAPGGETVSLRIPAVRDADGDGAYDPGDRGLFFAQDSPIGGIGPGPTLMVEATSKDPPSGIREPPVSLSVRPMASNLSASDSVIPIEVEGNDSDRAVRIRLRHAADNTTVATRTDALGADGTVRVEFDAVPGRYRVSVSAIRGHGSALSDPFAVVPAQNVTLHPPAKQVSLGEMAPFGLTFARPGTVTVRLTDSMGTPIESVTVRSDLPRRTHRLAIDTAGRSPVTAGRGFGIRAGANDTAPTWVTAAIDRTANTTTVPPPTHPGSGQSGTTGPPVPPRAGDTPPLGVGNYTLSVHRGGETVVAASVEVTATWTATVETLVAPQSTVLDSAASVRRHASSRDRIAAGDRLVIAVNTTGLGAYAKNIFPGRMRRPGAENRSNRTRTGPTREPGAEIGPATRIATPPAFVSVGAKSSSGREASTFWTGFDRVETDRPGRFYLVANDTVSAALQPGRALEMALVLTEESPFVGDRTPNRTARVTYGTELGVIRPRATVAGATRNDTLSLPLTAAAPITGTATVAPGTIVTAHVLGTDPDDSVTVSTVVTEDGSYATTANVSEFDPGASYTVSVTANGERISDLHTGQFAAAESAVDAAAGGGGGGWAGSASRDEPTDPEPTTTAPTEMAPDPVPDIPERPIERVLEEVPEPLRLGLAALLIIALGSLALGTVGVGLKRLLRP